MEASLLKPNVPYLTNTYLSGLFKNHKYPKDKIKNLVKKGDLIKIRKGLYLPGDIYNKDYSNLVLSGIIYGPSAVSLESALSYHGLIPDRVTNVTCICFKRDKIYQTAVGDYTYRYLNKKLYPAGLQYCQTSLGNFFIASAEKALCDMAYYQKAITKKNAYEYLIDDLRIDKLNLNALDTGLLLKIANTYKRSTVKHLVNSIIFNRS